MNRKSVLRAEREIEVLNNHTGIWSPQKVAKKKFRMAKQREDTLKKLKCLIVKVILFKLL